MYNKLFYSFSRHAKTLSAGILKIYRALKFSHNTENGQNRKLYIWIHAVSVGEVSSIVPLIYELKKIYGRENLVFSVTTKTGYEIAEKLLKDEVSQIFFFPFDLIFSVKYILKKINPRLIILNETDVWLNFMQETKKLNIPIILVNARLKKSSIKWKVFLKDSFLNFDHICVQTKRDENNFKLFGYPPYKMTVTGNTKFDMEIDNVDNKQIEKLKESLGITSDRRVILAGSTHKGEEIIIKDAFIRLKDEIKNLLLIIAPRHPERANEAAKIFDGFKVEFASKILEGKILEDGTLYPLKSETEVIVIDKIGILRKLYAVCDIAFLGGSLLNYGGHNPLEPAAYSKPILTGENINDFKDIFKMLLESKGTIKVSDSESFFKSSAAILSDKEKAAMMGKANFDVLTSHRGSVLKLLKIITKTLA